MTRDALDRHRSLRILVGLAIVAVAFYVIGVIFGILVQVGDVILWFLLSWIIAFILEPVSTFLQRRGIPRIWAVSLIYVALLIVVSGGIVLAILGLQGQVRTLANELTTTFSPGNIPALEQKAIGLLHSFGLSQQTATDLVHKVATALPQKAQDLSNSAVATATSLVTSILNIIFAASLIVIISFYIMLDGPRLVESLVLRLPPAWIPDVRLFQRNVQDIFGGFFRAQLIVAGIYAVLTWLVLLILGAPDGVIAAVLSGILMLLPFLGVFLAIIPPALILLIQTPPNQLVIKMLILVILLGAAQHVVLNLMAPRIFGHHMGVPTLITFAALLFGAKQGGVWGAFFAGPIVAVGWAMFEVFYERFQFASSLFPHHQKGETGEGEQEQEQDGEARRGPGTLTVTGNGKPGGKPGRGEQPARSAVGAWAREQGEGSRTDVAHGGPAGAGAPPDVRTSEPPGRIPPEKRETPPREPVSRGSRPD